ncbi:MAG: transketolase [Planctomycetes bacterium]|nr:transketolase [Planctomycetota bacterium]
MRSRFVKALCELAVADERVWLLTGDLGYSVLEPFRERFPKRYVNAGIAEQNMTGVAAGLAQFGKIVFTYSIANFPTLRCLEQIRNDVCYHKLPVRIVSVGGGFAYGSAGYTHQGLEDLAVLRALPGMTVIAPGDPVEAGLATRASLELPGPCYLRLGKGGEAVVHQEQPDFAIGRAIRVREGHDVTLISTGGLLGHTLEVATQLAEKHRIEARVLSMHTLKPLDEQTVRAAASETGGVVTVEEHSVTGGLGSAVADVLAELDGARPPFRKFGAPDRVNHQIGSQKHLRGLAGDLGDAVRTVLGRGPA